MNLPRTPSLARLALAAVLLALAAATRQTAEPPPTPRLNLLLVLADDCTVWDTSVYGGQAATPNLEKLATEGMTFTGCFQAAPMCSPTRHALYTSLYPVRSGAYPNHTYVREGVESVAKWLTDAGYRAHLSGKTHVNPKSAFPFEYSRVKERRSVNPDFDAIDEFLAECERGDTPFGLFVCSNEPHTPWNQGDSSAYPPEELELAPIHVDTLRTREGISKYLAEITFFDGQLGRALALLERHGFAESTMVVVLTEQGNSLPFAKWTCYEAGVASGLIVRWPGRVEPASTSGALVEYVDVVPTFLEAAGIAVPEGLDGRSFLEVLAGKRETHADCVYSLQTSRGIQHGPEFYGIRSVRDERFRYILNLTPDETFVDSVMTGGIWNSWERAIQLGDERATLLTERYLHRPAEELYEVGVDRWCERNLAGDPRYEGDRARLRAELEAWMARQGDLGQETELAAEGRLWRNRTGKTSQRGSDEGDGEEEEDDGRP